MDHCRFTRRTLFGAGAGACVLGTLPRVIAQQQVPLKRPAFDFIPTSKTPMAALMKGADRRKTIHDSLVAIDKDIRAGLKRKKYVLIKPNNVSTENQLAATHADALRGILDYLDGRFKGVVYIAESSAGETFTGYENFRYNQVAKEYRRLQVRLLDLNEEAKYEVLPVLDDNLHLSPVRLAARLFDPEAYIISSAILKTHNVTVATLGIKNMTLGAPLHQAPKETQHWNDKRKYHFGVRQTHHSMLLTAQKMAPFWNLSVIDGHEGMEGNGPASGTPVPSRVAIASTDFVTADRLGVECMGINPAWPGYLNFCHQAGVGQYDIGKINIVGEPIATVQRKYRLHSDIERELLWMGPMTDIPPKLG
jgi:uncharacterized protein (DUF362 family)